MFAELDGKCRLRQVAKLCERYGQRVQCSVFEIELSSGEYKLFLNELLNIIDDTVDSVRVYCMGRDYKRNVEQYGKKISYFVDDLLIL